jgi:thioredoxin reductase (NADPH)
MESFGADLKFMSPKPFSEEQLAAIRAISSEHHYKPGELVTAVGDPLDRFVLVVEGELEVVDPVTGNRFIAATLRSGQFMGELNFLNAGRSSLAARATCDTVTLEAPQGKMLELMSEVPEISDHVLTVFAARRRLQFEEGRSALTLVGADRDRGIEAIASFLSRNRIPFRSLAVDDDAEGAALLLELAGHQPAVIIGRDRKIEDPTLRSVAGLLGLDLAIGEPEEFDLLIVGGGPAGIAAAVYAGAEGLKALLIEDAAIGGQAGTSSRIENYMGFPTGISGADLVFRGQIQAMKFGTRFAMPRRVEKLEKNASGFCATLDDGRNLCARAVLVATGVQYQRLPIPGLRELEGAGVYYAATEMEAKFCRETEAVIVGGGNSAGQAAMYLSRYARHVHLLVRGGELASSMSEYLRRRLDADPRISIHYGTQLESLEGDERLTAVHVRGPDGVIAIPATALFIMIGAAPNTQWLSGLVELDEKGFVPTGSAAGSASAYETSHPGIFAVGDVRAGSVKRVASSVGEGSVVVGAIWSRLNLPEPEALAAY